MQAGIELMLSLLVVLSLSLLLLLLFGWIFWSLIHYRSSSFPFFSVMLSFSVRASCGWMCDALGVMMLCICGNGVRFF